MNKVISILIFISSWGWGKEPSICDQLDVVMVQLSSKEKLYLFPDLKHYDFIIEVCQQTHQKKKISKQKAYQFYRAVDATKQNSEQWLDKNMEEVNRVVELCSGEECSFLNDDEKSLKKVAKAKDVILMHFSSLFEQVHSQHDYEVFLKNQVTKKESK